MSWLTRRPVPLLVLASSTLVGASYRFLVPREPSSLNPHTFVAHTLVDKQPVSSTSALFTLRSNSSTSTSGTSSTSSTSSTSTSHGASEAEHVSEAWKTSIWSVQIKQPQLQIARAYTPLPPPTTTTSRTPSHRGEGGQDVRLLIRHETGGEVSTYLHRLPPGSTVELRGPHAELVLPEDVEDVVFLAGGTGIAPAMQMAQALGPRARMEIFWANRRREDCIGAVSDGDGNGNGNGNGNGGEGHSRPWQAPTARWFSRPRTRSPPTTSVAGAEPATHEAKGVMVAELDALKQQCQARGTALSIRYYVDDENTILHPRAIQQRLAAARLPPGKKLVVVSGPAGFLEYWAGRKEWAGGREVQGPLRGQLGSMDLGDWQVVKL